MADALRDVSPGDGPARLLDASTFNMMLGATRWWRDNVSAIGAAPPPSGSVDQLGGRMEVRVKPASDLPQFAVVSLGSPVIDPAVAPVNAMNTPVFEAVAPTDGSACGITVAPIGAGKIGRVVLVGVAAVDVVVSDADHRWARPIVGDTTALESAESGPAFLLAPPGLGTHTTLVLLGAPPAPPEEVDTGGTGASCTGSGWIRALRQERWLRAFVVGEDAGPITDCSACPDGAPRRFKVEFPAGGTGDFFNLGGFTFLTRSTDCTWEGTFGLWDVTATALGDGEWSVTATNEGVGASVTYIVSGVTTCLDEIDGFAVDDTEGSGDPPTTTLTPVRTSVGMSSPDGAVWYSVEDHYLVICGVEYEVQLAPLNSGCNQFPCATITQVAPGGSGSGGFAFTVPVTCAGCCFAVFEYPLREVCPDADVPDDPCDDVVRVQIECSLEPGWYCVADTDAVPAATCADGPKVVVEVESGDDTSGLIACAGPYETEEEAEGCGLVPDDCDFCPGETLAESFLVPACPTVAYSGTGCEDPDPCDPALSVIGFNVRIHWQPGGACHWFGPVGIGTPSICDCAGALWYLRHSGTKMVLQFEDFCVATIGPFVTYEVEMGDWDCQSPLTLTKTFESTICINFPDMITITPS